MTYDTLRLPAEPDVRAPDGANVRVLLQTERGSMAHFELPAGEVSKAVAHHTVEEIWFILGGIGEMWRRLDGRETITQLDSGVCVTIPVGTEFQFRSLGVVPLTAVAVTMPPWPGMDEAYEVEGAWQPTV